jgi:hypothetical protein
VDGRKDKALTGADLVVRVSLGRNEAEERQDKLNKRDMSFYPEGGSSMFLCNIDKYRPD